MLFIFDEAEKQSFHMTETRIPLDIAFITHDGIIESIKQLEPLDETPVSSDGDDVICALEVNRGWFEQHDIEVGDEIDIEEGKKDACYHKVKSRYSVWPSAYASGALVKCRKVGAANWGNKTKKEEFEMDEAKKCWPGYKKAGTQKLFGKTYNRCVKAGDEITHDGEQIDEYYGMAGGMGGSLSKRLRDERLKSLPKTDAEAKKKEEVKEAAILPRKTGQIVKVLLTFRGKMYAIQMFFPSIVKPSRAEVQDQIEKVYPGGKVRSYDISDYEPGQPLLHTEDWQKKSGKNPEGGLNEKGRKSYERQNSVLGTADENL
jgi:hypothetical protein